MPILQIRDVPDDVYQAVAAAAQAEHRSLSQQAIVALRSALGVGAKSQSAGIVQQLRFSERRLPVSVVSPEALQREERDSR
jgi:antitoxin FitA